MDDLLFALVELVLQVLLEFAAEIVMDLLSRAAAEVFRPEEPSYQIGTWFACAVYGALAGAVSLGVLPHPLFHHSKIRGVSLIVSPTITGAVMSGIGAMLKRRGKRVVRIESFPYAFAFAFGMALVRFLFAF